MDGMMVLAVVIAAVLFAAVIWRRRPREISDLPYVKGTALFSPAERSFLGVLEQAIGTNHRVFGKVRVADVLKVQKNLDRSRWQRAFNRISAKHFDFIVCRVDDLSVVCAIELDDRSHGKDSRRTRDDFIAAACAAASLPLLQIPAQRAYPVQELRDRVQALLESPCASHKATGA